MFSGDLGKLSRQSDLDVVVWVQGVDFLGDGDGGWSFARGDEIQDAGGEIPVSDV
jgi:hypothetical protein